MICVGNIVSFAARKLAHTKLNEILKLFPLIQVVIIILCWYQHLDHEMLWEVSVSKKNSYSEINGRPKI